MKISNYAFVFITTSLLAYPSHANSLRQGKDKPPLPPEEEQDKDPPLLSPEHDMTIEGIPTVKDMTIEGIPTVKDEAAFHALGASRHWNGGYYVADHSMCGQPNIPNTYGDTLGFITKSPSWHNTNFVWGNSNVWADDFKHSSDYYWNSYMPANYDGADSVVIGYVSSHGATWGTTFYLSAGSPYAGGCTVSSNQMSLGESNLRYMFLSTCQSVQKVRPGDVWFGPANGIRAIFGYHTNIIDSDKYGRYFYENWMKAGAKTTDAFLDASWRISHYQEPVAAWFGETEAQAKYYRDYEMYFRLGAISDRWIAWRYYNMRSLGNGLRATRIPNMKIRFTNPMSTSDAVATIKALAPGIKTNKMKTNDSGDSISYETEDGSSLVVNKNSGSLDLRLPELNRFEKEVLFTDDEAISMASEYVQRIGTKLKAFRVEVKGASSDLRAAEVRHTMDSAMNQEGKVSQERLTHVMVVFRPVIDGVQTIGTGGVVEVTLDADKTVCRVRSVLREVAEVTRTGDETDVSDLQQRAEARALKEIKAQPHVDDCKIVKSEFGFFAADESVRQDTSEPSFSVLVEITSGQFSRLFERIYSVNDLEEQGK